MTGRVLCGRQPQYCLVVVSWKSVEAEIKALSFTLAHDEQPQCTHIACVTANALSSLSACVYQMGIHAPGCGLLRAGQALPLGTLFLSRGDDLGGHLSLKQGQGSQMSQGGLKLLEKKGRERGGGREALRMQSYHGMQTC